MIEEDRFEDLPLGFLKNLIDFEDIQPLQAMLFFFFLEASRSFNGDFDELGELGR